MERKENIAVFDMNLKTMDRNRIDMKNEEYESPQVEVIECEVEKGFAASLSSVGYSSSDFVDDDYSGL